MLATTLLPPQTPRHRRSPSLVSPSPPLHPCSTLSLAFLLRPLVSVLVAAPGAMAARAALARSVRPLLLRRGVATTAPAAASSAVAVTGASLRAELEKVQRFSPNLPEEEAAVLLTPEVRADIAAISAAEDALMGTIDTTDVSVDWVGCPISVPPVFRLVLWADGARDAGEEVVRAVSLPAYATRGGRPRHARGLCREESGPAQMETRSRFSTPVFTRVGGSGGGWGDASDGRIRLGCLGWGLYVRITGPQWDVHGVLFWAMDVCFWRLSLTSSPTGAACFYLGYFSSNAAVALFLYRVALSLVSLVCPLVPLRTSGRPRSRTLA